MCLITEPTIIRDGLSTILAVLLPFSGTETCCYDSESSEVDWMHRRGYEIIFIATGRL